MIKSLKKTNNKYYKHKNINSLKIQQNYAQMYEND